MKTNLKLIKDINKIQKNLFKNNNPELIIANDALNIVKGHPEYLNIFKKHKDNEITCFLHPINFKNRSIPNHIKNRVRSLPESLDCYLNDLCSFQEIYIGRSFTTVALLNTLSLNDSIINVCFNLEKDLLDKKFYLFLKNHYSHKRNLNYILI